MADIVDNVSRRIVYVGWERNWSVCPCPECGQPATSHGYLFWDEPPPPPAPLPDAFGHVYVHENTHQDCVLTGRKHV